MTDEIKYHLKLFEVTSSANEEASAEYICQLAAVMANDRSNILCRKWARSWLDEIKLQHGLRENLNKTAAAAV